VFTALQQWHEWNIATARVAAHQHYLLLLMRLDDTEAARVLLSGNLRRMLFDACKRLQLFKKFKLHSTASSGEEFTHNRDRTLGHVS
jgi:hypothetical protein